jgi:hypothetical protein
MPGSFCVSESFLNRLRGFDENLKSVKDWEL